MFRAFLPMSIHGAVSVRYATEHEHDDWSRGKTVEFVRLTFPDDTNAELIEIITGSSGVGRQIGA